MSRDLCSQRGLSVLRLAVATSGKAPSEEGFLPAFEQVSRLPLEQTIGGKSGVLTSFLRHFNICLAHMLICTNSLSLLKGPFLQYVPASSSESIPHWWPQALLRASGRSAHLSHVAWFPCLPGQVGNAGPRWALEADGTASGQESRSFPLGGGGLCGGSGLPILWQLSGFTGSPCSSWRTGVFLVVSEVPCLQISSFFSPSGTMHNRALRGKVLAFFVGPDF